MTLGLQLGDKHVSLDDARRHINAFPLDVVVNDDLDGDPQGIPPQPTESACAISVDWPSCSTAMASRQTTPRRCYGRATKPTPKPCGAMFTTRRRSRMLIWTMPR